MTEQRTQYDPSHITAPNVDDMARTYQSGDVEQAAELARQLARAQKRIEDQDFVINIAFKNAIRLYNELSELKSILKDALMAWKLPDTGRMSAAMKRAEESVK